jgi:hypothetical protein
MTGLLLPLLRMRAFAAGEWSGYTGEHVRLGDYYVREIERVGTEHRQVVRYEVVGTGRVESMPRSRFDRQARAV